MQSNSLVVNIYKGISGKIRRLFPRKDKKTGLNWFKEKMLKHQPPGKTRAYSFAGHSIYHRNPSEFLHTMKEIFGKEIYKVSLPEKALIIDCGANIGISTIYLKLKHPDARIIAFEPDEINFELLSKNTGSFGFQDIILRKEAVWTEDCTLQFAGDGNMGSRIEITGGTHPVKAVRLKNMLDQRVDFLKIDIEGAEYAVLKDIAPALPNVKNLFLEYHGKFEQADELTTIFTLLRDAGFSYYIQEATTVYENPFTFHEISSRPPYDVQLNIFGLRQ